MWFTKLTGFITRNKKKNYIHMCNFIVFHICISNFWSRKWYAVKHNCVTEVYLMTI